MHFDVQHLPRNFSPTNTWYVLVEQRKLYSLVRSLDDSKVSMAFKTTTHCPAERCFLGKLWQYQTSEELFFMQPNFNADWCTLIALSKYVIVYKIEAFVVEILILRSSTLQSPIHFFIDDFHKSADVQHLPRNFSPTNTWYEVID
jgi:hypothetical protein